MKNFGVKTHLEREIKSLKAKIIQGLSLIFELSNNIKWRTNCKTSKNST
jgi:hypothetical protein